MVLDREEAAHQLEQTKLRLKRGNARLLGEGERVIVLSHGFGADHKVWSGMLPNLLHRYRIVVYDLEGHGDEQVDSSGAELSIERLADNLVSILDELGVEKCSFVGHSVSAMIGCLASLARPQLFEKLILIAGSPRYLNDDDYLGGFDKAEVQNLLASIQQDCPSWVQVFVPLVLGPDTSEEAQEYYKNSFLQLNPSVTFAFAKAIFHSDYRHILPKITTPSHIVQTKNDYGVPYSAAQYLHRHLGAAEKSLDIVDVNGHLPHLTSPKLMVRLLDELLLRHEA